MANKGGRYNLSKYVVTIGIDETLANALGLEESQLQIGGEGSYTDAISVARKTNMWSTEADATGSWVHNQSLDASGTVELSINQMSDKIAKLKTIFSYYATAAYDFNPIIITVAPLDDPTTIIANCEDCLLQNIPKQDFAQTAGTQNWVFTCGCITFN